MDGCGALPGDVLTALNALPNANHTPTDDGGTTIAVVNNAFQNPHLVFNAIRDDGGAMNKAQARANFLKAIHKEIAIAKITAFLARVPVVNAGTLPNRAAAGIATALPQHNNNEYQDYVNFIRGNNEYTDVRLNDFVREMAITKDIAKVDA